MAHFDPAFSRVMLAGIVAVVCLFLTQTNLRRRQRSLTPMIGVALFGFGLAAYQYIVAGADLRAYDADPACRAGFALHGAHGGPCRVEPISISGYRVTRGRSSHREFDVVLASGRQTTVSYGSSEYGSVWRGLTQHDDRAGWAQFFRGDIIAIETRSGVVDTSSMPAQRFDQWAFVGILAGTIGTFSALVEAVRSRP